MSLNVWRWVVALLWLFLPVSSAAATTPADQRLSQYEHGSWRKQDGVLNVSDVTQASNGFIWLATASGLLRFDGIRFVPKNVFGDVSIEGWRIHAVYAARDGSVWVGASGQVGHIVGNRIERYKVLGWVNAFAEDTQGVVWFVQSRVNFAQGPLCSISDGKPACVGRPAIPAANLSAISADPAGGFWVGGTEGICYWSGVAPAQCHLRDMLGPDYGRLGVRTIFHSRDGTVWVGIGKADHPFGLGRWAGGRWTPVKAPDGSSLDVTTIAEDADGALWVGTMDRGIYRIRGNDVDHYGREDGLSGDEINGLLVDGEGTVWVATDDGVDAFRKLPVSAFSSHQGLPGNDFSSVAASSDGTVWVGTRPLSALRDDRAASAPSSALIEGKRVTAQLVDHAGRHWIGVESGLVVVDGRSERAVVDAAGHATGSIVRLVEDRSQTVWAQTTGPKVRLLRIHDVEYQEIALDRVLRSVAADRVDGIWLSFSDGTAGVLENGRFEQRLSGLPAYGRLEQESDGTIFVASAQGLVIQRGANRRLLDTAKGLPCATVFETIRDRRQALWLLTNCGIAKIEAPEFERWLAHPATSIQFQFLDASDGYEPGYSGFFPMAALAADGRLWFASDKFIQVVDPSLSLAKRPAPPVLIDEVLADRRIYPADGAIALPAKTRDLEIRYNALSFIVPQKIRFKYRLEGRDHEWTDAASRREAFYTDLAPGAYRFRVIACNSDGVWNAAGASVDFQIAAAFYQTGWFYGLCCLAGLVLLGTLTMLRLRQLSERVRLQVEARSHERERIARELHDTLLQGTQGLVLSFQVVAGRLPPRDGIRVDMEQILDQADEVIAEARDSLMALRASDPAPGDLRQRLQGVVDELCAGSSPVATLEVSGSERALSRDAIEELLRIGREALINAFRHARAGAVVVRLDYAATSFRLIVQDDGVGIDAATLASGGRPGHWGLTGMRERTLRMDATLTLNSSAGAGTELVVVVPAARAYVGTKRSRRWGRLVGFGGLFSRSKTGP